MSRNGLFICVLLVPVPRASDNYINKRDDIIELVDMARTLSALGQSSDCVYFVPGLYFQSPGITGQSS